MNIFRMPCHLRYAENYFHGAFFPNMENNKFPKWDNIVSLWEIIVSLWEKICKHAALFRVINGYYCC